MHPLQRIRQERRLTQKALHYRSGVSTHTISRIETGGTNPGMVVRRKLLDSLFIRLERHREIFGELQKGRRKAND